MRKAYKYRIYLTNGQQRMLDAQLEESRSEYNQTLAARRDAHAAGTPLGLYATQALLSGWKAERPALKRDEADLKRVQKRKDTAKNAQDWDENRKQTAILARIHERIANRRADFAHKQSRARVGKYQVIAFEELAPLEMGKSKGRGMRKSIMDVAWMQFIRMTTSKAAEAGRSVILVNPHNTSKMCSRCGTLVPKMLGLRVHTCPVCGLSLDRDVNAALNILHRGLQTLNL